MLKLNKSHVILLSGRAVSGKSTSKSHLIYEIENTYKSFCQIKQYSCASKLKRFLHEVMNIPKPLLYGNQDEKNQLTHLKWATLPINGDVDVVRKLLKAQNDIFLTGRESMEVFGSYICRRWWPDCWANAVCNEILSDTSPHIAIIDDIRFPNEIEYISSQCDYTIIRLTRNPLNRQSISETALDKFEWHKYNTVIIDNSGECSIETKNQFLNTALENIIHNLCNS